MVSKVEGGGLPGFGIQGEKKGLSQKVEGEKVDFFLSSFGERVQNRKNKKKGNLDRPSYWAVSVRRVARDAAGSALDFPPLLTTFFS